MSEDNVVAECPSCGRRGEHRRTHVAKTVHLLRCEDCRTVNAFSVTPGESESKPRFAAADVEALLTATANVAKACTYRATEPFFAGNLISHPTFGIGYVLAIVPPAKKKMEVLFSDKRRVLVCGPGSDASLPADEQKQPKPPPRAKASRRPTKRKTAAEATTTSAAPDAPVTCPSCGHVVHPFNILHTPGDQANRCMRCS